MIESFAICPTYPKEFNNLQNKMYVSNIFCIDMTSFLRAAHIICYFIIPTVHTYGFKLLNFNLICTYVCR